jgi:hypothetical protein
MKQLSLEPLPARRLVHYTPLRYPGGKGKLAAYIKTLIKENQLLDGEYVEPYGAPRRRVLPVEEDSTQRVVD